ncbi:hypothetical protein FRC09_000029 [Ceratobasidium sp. 395]|nr:hypothetical protein FRC09_000029 [Ceratobasidium sp. 395]
MKSSESRLNIYDEAFEAWKNAHAQFKAAVAMYSDACSAFDTACSGPLARNGTQSMLEDALSALDSELPGLASDIEQAVTANRVLKALRNKSATVVRINKLPSEVLIRIFGLLCHSRQDLCGADNPYRPPRILACVNTYWRQLILSNSHLWTRINLASLDKLSEKPLEHTQAQLTCAGTLPLDVVLDGTQQWSDHSLFQKIRDLLREVAPRLRSLTYQADRPTGFSPREVLLHWIRHGTPGSGHTLKLLSYSSAEVDDLRPELLLLHSISMEQMDAFFTPVRHLALHRHYIGWSSVLYHNLVELDLSFDSSFLHFPTTAEFAAVLSASPGLHALKLFGFGLQSSSPSDAVRPIRLDHLEILFLKGIHSRSLKLLLPMLQPGSTPLYMRFDVPKRSADTIYYAQLLQRSSVIKLMVKGNGNNPPQSLLASLAGVQHLLLYNFVVDIPFWESMQNSLVPHANQQYPSVWPSLRTLHLFECGCYGSEYKRYLKKPIPHNFMLWIWVGDQFYEMDGSQIKRNSPKAQKILRVLSRYVPGMQEVQENRTIMFEAWRSALYFAPYF